MCLHLYLLRIGGGGRLMKRFFLPVMLVAVVFLVGCEKVPAIQLGKVDKGYCRKVLRILRTCDIQAGRLLKATNLALLSSAYPRVHCAELDRHCPDLVNYGGVLLGRLMPWDLHHQDLMLSKGVLSECPSCRLDGRESCFTCRGTGVCAKCKGTGKASKKAAFGGGIWDVAKSDDEDQDTASEGDVSVGEQMERCPIKCTVCKGTGHLAKACRRCGGRKYLLNRKKLRLIYIEQYKIVEAIVKSHM